MSDDKSRPSVPFEPRKNKQRKSANKGTPIVKSPEMPKAAKLDPNAGKIPEVVSNRMIRRVMAFSGIPVLLGMGVFIASYFIVINHIYKLPNTLVLLTSMAFLGLSVLGLSYGILSASWDEALDASGSLLGWSEFKVNFGRMAEAYKASKQMQQSNRE